MGALRTVVTAVFVLAALFPAATSHGVATNSLGYQWADFDGDGFGDLAIGAPGESIGAIKGAGAVHVLYGGGSGLRSSNDQLWHQNSNGLVDGRAEAGDHFGEVLAVGDFDGDSFDDLAIGSPDEDSGSATDGGFVFILYGSGSGLRTTGSQVLRQGAGGIEGTTEDGDHFGAALAAGDFNGDGISDLAIGVPDEDLGAKRNAGAVAITLGHEDAGLSGANADTYTQDSPGFGGLAEAGDRFGFALTSGDFDGTGTDDLAIGSPFDSVDGRAAEGVVHVIRSDSAGLDTTKVDLLDQDTIFREREGFSNEKFGYSLASGDFDPDDTFPAAYDDLAVGVPGDLPGHSGAVDVLLGSEEGFVGRAEEWFQGRAGAEAGAVPGARETNDDFGASVHVNDFDGNGAADLAVGVPGEGIGNHPDAGGVNVIYSEGTMLDPATGPSQFWSQQSRGIAGDAETGDMFGEAITSGDFDDDNGADLAIGAPGEDISGRTNAGVAHVIYDQATGPLKATGSEIWSQNTTGIAGSCESGDELGGGLS